MTKQQYKLCAPCLFGLESVLSGEIKRLGFEDITVTDGRVEFTADAKGIARANLNLRTAERVLIILGSFRAVTFQQLIDGAEKIPFEEYIGKKDAFPVKGWSLNSQLHSVPDCQSIIKKAAVKRLSRKYGVAWLEESGPAVQIQFSINKDLVTIMLDTSGVALHKRGYRKVANLAPIRETLAAGILDIARIYPDTKLYDPFCGSGTFLIEAAYKAKNIAPGIYRRFAAEKWGCLPASIWQSGREEAIEKVRKDVEFVAFGSDISGEALDIAEANARRAGIAGLIKLKDSAEFNPTINDIETYNTKITIEELKANVIPSTLADVTAAVVNGNYALDFGLKTEDAIYKDDQLDIEEYWNLIAARSADLEDADKLETYKKVVAAFQSDETEKVFNDQFGGYFIKAGWDQDLLADK